MLGLDKEDVLDLILAGAKKEKPKEKTPYNLEMLPSHEPTMPAYKELEPVPGNLGLENRNGLEDLSTPSAQAGNLGVEGRPGFPAPPVTNRQEGPQRPRLAVSPLPPPQPPPPVPTNVPVGQPEPSGAIPEPQPEAPLPNGLTRGETAQALAYKRDPNELLKERYKDALAMALQARDQDIKRQLGGDWRGLMTRGAGFITHNPQLVLKGQEMMNAANVDPIYAKSLEQAGRSAQEITKAQYEGSKLDPNSDFAEGLRIAMMGHPSVNSWALSQSNIEKRPLLEVKQELYDKLKSLTPVGMQAYLDALKTGGDFSKQRSDELLNYAHATQIGAQTDKLRSEIEDFDTAQKAWNDPNSAISELTRQIIKYNMPEKWSQIPGFANLTAHNLAKQFPDMLPSIINTIKTQHSIIMQNAADTQVDGDTVVKVDFKESPLPGMGPIPVANPVAVANRPNYINQKVAMQQAMIAADEAYKSIGGMDTTVSVKLGTDAGRAIMDNLKTFARNAAVVSPTGKTLLDQLESIRDSDSFIPSQFIFGAKGRKASVMEALKEINRAHVAATEGQYTYPKIIQGQIPEAPPVHLPMTIIPKTDSQGRKYNVYEFNVNGRKIQYRHKRKSGWTHWQVEDKDEEE